VASKARGAIRSLATLLRKSFIGLNFSRSESQNILLKMSERSEVKNKVDN
jgi:hypothetical protein